MKDKQLLIQDLCARLPYGVNIKTLFGDFRVCAIDYKDEQVKTDNSPIYEEGDNWWSLKSIKPYLRPMSSMTEEEKEDYQYITERWMSDANYSIADSIDWLNAHHFDYRGLIEKNLALEAPKEMYNE